MNKITVNGKTYETEGKNISVINGVVTVDGKQVGGEVSGVVEIKFEGDLASLKSDASVSCGNVQGTVQAGGSVNADNVGGDINAGGSVNCDATYGTVTARGSLTVGNMHVKA